ncbi:hypothetical protein [Sporosarcina sp. FSL W7-1283]|uniref:hypothetical protein n=1 Tax=Sporosarcina sp. FSL W7-1283 TaxID=2921560 RepID=UPI0030FA8989
MVNDSKLIEKIVRNVIMQLDIKPQMPGEVSKPSLFVHNADERTISRLEENWKVICEPITEIPNVIFLEVSQNILAKGALGLTDDPDSQLLSELLLQGKQITMIPVLTLEWVFSPERLRTKYHDQLVTYKKKLESFGVTFTTLEMFISSGLEKNQQSFCELLTDQEVRKYTDETIWIEKSTIVTPLARDTARELGKTIKWNE